MSKPDLVALQDAIDILSKMSEQDDTVDVVLWLLDEGMQDEWDCGLFSGVTTYGFIVDQPDTSARRQTDACACQSTQEEDVSARRQSLRH